MNELVPPSRPSRAYPVEIETHEHTPPAPDLGVVGFDLECDDLIELYLRRFDRPSTRASYRRDLEDFFQYALGLPGGDPVVLRYARRVTFVAVHGYLEHLEAQKRAGSTLRRRIAAIRGFFDLLVALEAIDRNPAHPKLVRRVPKAGNPPVIFLSRSQTRRLVDAAHQPDRKRTRKSYRGADDDVAPVSAARDRALLLTMIFGVLRRSEAEAINAGHVRRSGAYHVLDIPQAKGGQDEWIVLDPRAVQAIEEMQAEYGRRFGWTFNADEPLFRSLANNSFGERLTDRSIYRVVRRLALRAGLLTDDNGSSNANGVSHEAKGIGAHTLRHTGCTLAFEGGASLKDVQEHARHKDVSTTMRYVHQRERLENAASRRMDF